MVLAEHLKTDNQRILFFSFPHLGHVRPSLGPIAAMLRQGFQITAVTAAEYEPYFAGCGCDCLIYPLDLRPLAVGTDEGILTALTDSRITRRTLEFHFEIFAKCLAMLRAAEAANQWHLLLYDSYAPWGNLVGEALGIRRIALDCFYSESGAVSRSCLVDYLMEMEACSSQEAENLLAANERHSKSASRMLKRRYGLDPEACDLRYGDNRQVVLINDFLQPYRQETPVTWYANRWSDHTHPDWQNQQPGKGPGRRRRIYLTQGRSRTEHSRKMLSGWIRLFALLPEIELTVSTLFADDLTAGGLPANVRVAERFDQVAEVAQSELFITHGGVSGVKEAILLQVPMLLMPQGVQEFAMARQVERLGLGVLLRQVPQDRRQWLAVTRACQSQKTARRLTWYRQQMLDAEPLDWMRICS